RFLPCTGRLDDVFRRASATFERIDQIAEGFTIGLVQLHEDVVRFEHPLAGAAFVHLRVEVTTGDGTLCARVNDLEDIVEAHGFQQAIHRGVGRYLPDHS